MKPIRLIPLLAACALFVTGAAAEPQHGIAMHGAPALPPDFTHLPYANPEAPKGGQLRLAMVGSFDSTNQFIVKGTPDIRVRTYVVESLLARNWNEPFSLYGLLAETIEVSGDRQSFTFRLRPQAKFSDGTPVTAADVAFSMETLRDKGRPNFRNSYSKITRVETPDERTITFHQESGDRELPLIVGLMPVLSKAYWDGKAFDASGTDPILGSGPYVIGTVKPGETISYRKNPDYWAKDLPVARGLWNFDEVRVDYYRDANAAFEAFKSGLVDLRFETDPGRWATGYDFPAATEGKVIKEAVPQKTPAPASGFVFNTRRELFADPRVREALVMAFDFEWANANLFGNIYRRTYGFYSGSPLSSEGKPVDDKERAVLGDATATLRADFLDGSYRLPVSDGSGRDRRMLRQAVGLLAEAGWTITDNGLVNAAGQPFAFTLSVQQKDHERLALHYQRTLQTIGIKAEVRLVDAAQFASIQKTYDYDMIPASWFNSLSPGNEQKFYFGAEARDIEGTRNYPGIADPGVDRAIAAMLDATSREDFEAAVRAEDRLLVSGFYMVPFFDAGGQWVARWSHIGRPDAQPLPGFETTTLWRNP